MELPSNLLPPDEASPEWMIKGDNACSHSGGPPEYTWAGHPLRKPRQEDLGFPNVLRPQTVFLRRKTRRRPGRQVSVADGVFGDVSYRHHGVLPGSVRRNHLDLSSRSITGRRNFRA
ncbi:hypothetical protein QN277_014208 [Acacia crassicarpa]|uniref:Uncharacterized protein n=1 Tax=Acacia crassicarpa TaxID=499986 RepID=A0AAE1N457_9FABA|nr:hypothetical protein QN277_014208 [Acacia crassicarpa]